MNDIYTRDQYMIDSRTDGIGAHRRFFGQFVTPSTISRVVGFIGKDRILASTDRYMNDIPLELWDRLVSGLPGSAGFAKAGDYYTTANGVCLAKEAARQWVETQNLEG
jgi:hypothetical protein